MISLDYITLTSFGDPPEATIQTTEEETRSSVPGQAEVVDTHEDGLNFKQDSSLSELLEACDSMIEDYGPPLDYSLSQLLFLKPEREVIGKLVEERHGTMIVSKDDGAIFHRFQANIRKEATEEAEHPQAKHSPWSPEVQRGCDTARKKKSRQQLHQRVASVVAKLDHNTLRRLWRLVERKNLQTRSKFVSTTSKFLSQVKFGRGEDAKNLWRTRIHQPRIS